MGVGGPETVCDGQGLGDEASASRHLRLVGCRGGQEAVRKLLRLGACDTGTDRGVARTDGPSGPDDRGHLEGILATGFVG